MMLRMILVPFLSSLLHVEAEVMSSVTQFPITATTSNASTPFFANTTSINLANFSYIIPYGQSQECDIYGPICQTGSITVGVNLTTAIATTVLPCSSYLTAQSSYLAFSGDGPGMVYAMPEDWQVNFGHNPECRSYADEFGNGRYTISGCGDQNTVIQSASSSNDGEYNYPSQIPPGLVREFTPYDIGVYCGNCSLVVSEVRLYYFPDSTTPTCQYNQTSNFSSILSDRNLENRVHSLVANGSIAIVSGHTFTSPSVYLQIVGTAAVSDECTAVGSTLTNPIITLPPGGLSTWKPPSASDQELYGMSYAVGDVWEDPIAVPELGMFGELAPLTIKDLACPTWGLGRSTSADGTVITTIGPPWLPLIAPPMEAFSLDPTWALLCTGVLSKGNGVSTFALFDPPVALTRASGLVSVPLTPVIAPTSVPAPNHADPTTVPDKQVAPSTVAAKPASSPVDPVEPPARTGDPIANSPGPSLASSDDPAKPSPPPGDPIASLTIKSDPPAEPGLPQPVAPAISATGAKDSPADPIVPSSDGTDPQNGDPQIVPADPKAPTQPASRQGGDSQPQTQGLGAIIYNAFGKPGPNIGGIESEVSTISVPTAGIQKISIGGGQVLSVDPSGIQFEGKTYSVGGPAMTFSNKVYTLVPQSESENSAINDDDTLIDDPPLAPSTLTIAGHTVVPNPTGMIIAGSSVLPGGSAVTIFNTRVSLDPSGILVVGSSSFSLPPQSIFTIGTHPFTANPTGFILNGATIFPGAAAKTIDGTIVSLGQSGALAIGSSTVSLPTPSSTSPAISPFTVADHTFTPNPTAFSIAGTMVSAGGPAVTLAGTIISLGQSGVLTIGSSTISLPTLLFTPPAVSALTVDGQTFTPNPTAFSIAGTTISAGGPAVTLAGTIISLQPSGTLIIGSSTIPLLASPSSLLNINGLRVEAQSSLAIVDGVTINPGAPGVTVAGSIVSLEAGGATLDVGTGRFAMPTGSANGSASLLAFEGGQVRGMEVSLISLLLFGIGGTLMMLLV